MFFKISQNSQESTFARVSFLIKLQAEASNSIKKETLAQVFSYELCEIFKNNLFYRTPPVAASGQKRCLFWFMEIDPAKQNFRNLIKLFVYFENHKRRTLGNAHIITDSLNVTFTLSAPDQRQISNIFFIKSVIRLYIISLYCHFLSFRSVELFINYIKICVLMRLEWIFIH